MVIKRIKVRGGESEGNWLFLAVLRGAFEFAAEAKAGVATAVTVRVTDTPSVVVWRFRAEVSFVVSAIRVDNCLSTSVLVLP